MKWVSDTGPFLAALEEVRLAFQEVVSTEIQGAVAGQNEVTERLRRIEKQVGGIVSQISKQTARSELGTLAEESVRLEAALESVEDKLDMCIASILRIDESLPAHDRLIAPGLPNSDKYRHLHEKISARSVQKSPDRLQVQQSRPETRVIVDHATTAQVTITHIPDTQTRPSGTLR